MTTYHIHEIEMTNEVREGVRDFCRALGHPNLNEVLRIDVTPTGVTVYTQDMPAAPPRQNPSDDQQDTPDSDQSDS